MEKITLRTLEKWINNQIQKPCDSGNVFEEGYDSALTDLQIMIDKWKKRGNEKMITNLCKEAVMRIADQTEFKLREAKNLGVRYCCVKNEVTPKGISLRYILSDNLPREKGYTCYDLKSAEEKP